jgi:hypothetical protein
MINVERVEYIQYLVRSMIAYGKSKYSVNNIYTLKRALQRF